MSKFKNIINLEKLGHYVNEVYQKYNDVPPGLMTLALQMDIHFTTNRPYVNFHNIEIEALPNGVILDGEMFPAEKVAEGMLLTIAKRTYSNIVRGFLTAKEHGYSAFTDILFTRTTMVAYDPEQGVFTINGNEYDTCEQYLAEYKENTGVASASYISNIISSFKDICTIVDGRHNGDYHVTKIEGLLGFEIPTGRDRDMDQLEDWIKENYSDALAVTSYAVAATMLINEFNRGWEQVMEFNEMGNNIMDSSFVVSSLAQSLGIDMVIDKVFKLEQTTENQN